MSATAKILAIGANGAVVQLPERKFPGVVIQGDSLSIMLSHLHELRDAIAKGDRLEINDLIDQMATTLSARLEFYERTLEMEGLELPYSARPKNQK